jgi:hypothetical protein
VRKGLTAKAIIILAVLALVLTACAGGSGDDGGKPFTRGVVSGDTYQSEFFGIKFSSPKGYTFADDATLAQKSGVSADVLASDKLRDAFEDHVICDMQVQSSNGSSVSIMVEKAPNASMSEREYRDRGVEGLESGMRGTGAQILDKTDAPVTIGSSTFEGVDLSVSFKGREFVERQFVLKQGTYYGTVTITAQDAGQVDKLMSCFSLV